MESASKYRTTSSTEEHQRDLDSHDGWDFTIGYQIVQFISAGPKNYAYKLDKVECFHKVKGFTFDH